MNRGNSNKELIQFFMCPEFWVHIKRGRTGCAFCAALRVFRYGFGIFADIFEQKAVWMPLGTNIMEGIKRAFFGMPQK